MAGSEIGNKAVQGDESDIKRKLAWRMGVAGLMIIGLLGGLAIFDRLSAPGESESATSAPQFTEPVPVAKKVITQPVTPAEPTIETPKDEKALAEPESSAAPVDKSSPALEPPPRPEVASQPVLPRKTPTAGRAAATPSAASPPAQAAPARPSTEPPTTAVQAPMQSQPAPARLFSGYALQAGVFSDPRRAEELHARLMLEGIPSMIEARVEVGPFKTRAEADAARVKLKALGIDSVMLLPKGAKR